MLWRQAVPPVGPLPLFDRPATAALCSRLGWRLPGGGMLPLSSFTVRAGTALLLHHSGVEARRRAYFSAFCAAALQSPPDSLAVTVAVATFPAWLERLWRLRWANRHKEVLWRLLYNGVATPARLRSPLACACGHPSPDHCHFFWSCPIATALVSELSAQLPGAPALSQAQLWLGAPSPEGCHPPAWEVVCLCALAALDLARRAMWSQWRQDQPAPDDWVASLAARAVTRFWRLLTDFCAVGAAPGSFLDACAGTHPFFFSTPPALTFRIRRIPPT